MCISIVTKPSAHRFCACLTWYYLYYDLYMILLTQCKLTLWCSQHLGQHSFLSPQTFQPMTSSWIVSERQSASCRSQTALTRGGQVCWSAWGWGLAPCAALQGSLLNVTPAHSLVHCLVDNLKWGKFTFADALLSSNNHIIIIIFIFTQLKMTVFTQLCYERGMLFAS